MARLSLVDHWRLERGALSLRSFIRFLQREHLLSDLSLEQIQHSLRHFVLVSCLLFLCFAEIVEVHYAGKDTLANSINVVLGLLGPNVQRNLKGILNTCPLSQKQIQV